MRHTAGHLVFGTLAILYASLRFWAAASFKPSFDDIFTLQLVHQEWKDLLAATAFHDYHPPLFYVLLKLWIALGGESFVWLGLLPATISVATLLPFYLLCRELRMSWSATNFALLLMSVNGFLLGYTQELRMYSLMLLLTFTSMWLFVRFCNDSRRIGPLAWLTLVNVVLVYTQYFGAFVIAGQALYVLGWRRRELWPYVLSGATVVALFTPWAYMAAEGVRQRVAVGHDVLYPIGRPGIGTIAELLAALNGSLHVPRSTSVGIILFMAPVLALALGMLRTPARGSNAAVVWWLSISAVVPVAALFAASYAAQQSVWGQRHLITIAAPYMLLIAVAVERLPRSSRFVAQACLGAWAVLAGVYALASPYKVPAWDHIIPMLTRAAPSVTTPIYAVDEYVGWMLGFYLERSGWKGSKPAVVKLNTEQNRRLFLGHDFATPLWAQSVGVVLIDGPDDLDGKPFWLATRESRGALKESLERDGYRFGEGFTMDSVIRRQSETVGLVRVDPPDRSLHGAAPPKTP